MVYCRNCSFADIISFQVLIVAGGANRVSVGHSFTYLSSTEKMATGATGWTTIKPLPRKLFLAASVNMDNKIFLTGKFSIVLVSLLAC